MMLLDSGNAPELSGDFLEALFLGYLGELSVHIGPLIVLTLSSGLEVSSGSLDVATLKILEPQLRMLLLVLSGLKEDSSDLLISFLLCL